MVVAVVVMVVVLSLASNAKELYCHPPAFLINAAVSACPYASAQSSGVNLSPY